jgi:hypothetical protein
VLWIVRQNPVVGRISSNETSEMIHFSTVNIQLHREDTEDTPE